MKSLALILASQGLLFAASAYANPIMMEVALIREVPGPHVQLTYAVDNGKGPQTPSNPAIFGSKSTPWKAASYRTNTGSGLRTLSGIQMCDCNVPLGQPLVYKFAVASAYDGKSIDYSLAVTPTGTGKYDASVVDATPSVDGEAGVMPWDIPDPVEIQGIDCAAECTATQPLDGGASPLDAQGTGTGGAGGAMVIDAPTVADVAIGTAGAAGSDAALGVGGMVGTGGAPVIAGTGGAPVIAGTGGAPVIAGTGGTAAITGTGGAVGTGGSSAATTKSNKSDDGGCTMAHGSGSPGLVGLALLGLALIGRRKRRA